MIETVSDAPPPPVTSFAFTPQSRDAAPLCARFESEPRYEVKTTDLRYTDDAGAPMHARVYQPVGDGPFAMLVDIHGGAWHGTAPTFDRSRNAIMASDFASRGLVVASLEFRTAAVEPYPADLEDINCAIRALKANASQFNGTPDIVGGFGSSSGAHQILLAALRPTDARYTVRRHNGGGSPDGHLDFVVASCPPVNIPDLYRYGLRTGGNAERLHNFGDDEGKRQASPHHVVVGGTATAKPPILILHGSADEIDPMADSLAFARAYADEGGYVELFLAPGEPHRWVIPGLSPDTEANWRGMGAVRSFLERQIEQARRPYQPPNGP